MPDPRRPLLPHRPTGVHLLHEPALNKGTAFSEAERDALRLRGLLPPQILSQDLQVVKVLESVRSNTPSPQRRGEPCVAILMTNVNHRGTETRGTHRERFVRLGCTPDAGMRTLQVQERLRAFSVFLCPCG